jgi:membrane-bound lytic murein transglycosylase MltF
MLNSARRLLVALALLLVPAPTPSLAQQGADEPSAPEVESLPAIADMLAPFQGDLDQLVKRRYIRVLVTLNRTHYFLDRGEEHGAAYEGIKQFETWLNEKLGSKITRVQCVFIPVSHDRLLTALAEGRGDLAAANLTITPERSALVDFARPWLDQAREIVVTGRDAKPLASELDLAGHTVHVRKSSSYYSSLVALNEKLAAQGKAKVEIVEASEMLEDEDLLEMVSAGVIPATVVDSHIAEPWAEMLDGIVLHTKAIVRSGGSIAWAVRKGCPKLKQQVDEFAKENKKGTLLFNVIFKRYLKSTKWLKPATSSAELKKFRAALAYFQTYGKKYDLPWLLLAGLAYQESGIDQSQKSSAGAVGVMQIKPSTAEGKPIEIKGVESSMERNIEAGTKYLRFIADKHVNEPELDPLNRGLLIAASYNAGPTRIEKLRARAAKEGLDPNRWFGNVEVIAAKEIGRETVTYVANVYKYYVTYELVVAGMKARGEWKEP